MESRKERGMSEKGGGNREAANSMQVKYKVRKIAGVK